MRKASLISIGNELLSGQTVNSNAAHLSAELLSAGVPVVSTYVVEDQIDAIVRAFELAGADADVVIATGGLGPTDDDLTRQAMAEFLGVELELRDELLKKVESFFISRDRPMPAKNKIQACIPAGAKALANIGTAPGIGAESQGKWFFALPGVPSEMKRMFAESVLPELRRLASGQAVVVKKLKCFGAGESTIAEMLGTMMQRGRNPLINCTVSAGVITLHVIATAKDEQTAGQRVQRDETTLRGILGELVFGSAEQSLAQVVGEKLAQQNKTIAVAESCTGGLLAKMLTDVPGSSEYFRCGWITYSNQAKTSELGVPAELIAEYGAVSEQVAESMARGAGTRADTDFAIGITGIAGPTGGSEQKPVGLVYISVSSKRENQSRRFIFSHDRSTIRRRAAQTAINMLRLKLNV
ncbi:MAG: competence/damage-inducible protein A [Planctomycetes bacterium RBG_16_55_9]|nr:MAG: competence/damage-inducible protein A [Planctomycetes bacterium RBG_16_55_9]